MLLGNFTPVTLLLSVAQLISACPPLPDKRDTNGSTAFDIGADGPADPATIGYTINHFALVVNDINATQHFYGDILGMRHVFTFHATNDYSITYMGHTSGGKNGTGYQTGEEMLTEKNNREGLMEFLYWKGRNESDTVPAATAVRNTFSHIGLIVPDIMQVQQRLESYGVEILKAVGDDLSVDSIIPQAYGLGQNAMEDEAVTEGFRAIGFQDYLFVTDPDGNLLEIQQQN